MVDEAGDRFVDSDLITAVLNPLGSALSEWMARRRCPETLIGHVTDETA